MMHIQEAHIKLLTLLIGGLVVALLWQMVGVVKVQSDKWLLNQAVDGCLQAGQEEYANVEQNSKAITYNLAAYEFCMSKKGY